MKFIYFLAFVIILSSCSKTSEFAVPTSAYLIIPATNTVPSTITLTVDSIPTNFAYALQANQTNAGNVKQTQFQEVDFTITNNSYSQNFNFAESIKVLLSVGENKFDSVASYKAPVTAIGATTLQLSSGTNANSLVNSDFYNLSIIVTCTDTIKEDIQLKANILFYVKAKTD